MNTLRVDRVAARNYRCFSSCEVRLHPKLTVFVAENGQGKTAILDAVSMVLEPLVERLSGVRQWAGIEADDVRSIRRESQMVSELPTEVSAEAVIDGVSQHWALMRSSLASRRRTAVRNGATLRRSADSIRGRLDGFAQHAREIPPPLPLVAHYGTGRLWAEQRLTKGRRSRDLSTLGRLSGYQDCLASASSFKTFVAWYGDMAHAVRSPTSMAAASETHPLRLLSAVRKATQCVLAPTGWTLIDWEFPPRADDGTFVAGGYLVAEHPEHGRHPLSRLSDGVRSMVALVADVAHRCARLNPQFGEDAAARTPGVLLVDEVDMHLHPGWQQQVVGLLQTAFPAVQLLLTTHSPQVLSTVDSESIRMISVDADGRGQFRFPDQQTKGVESADVLARVMDVHASPKIEEAQWLSRYRALVEFGKDEVPEARQLWGRLIAHFGEQHPVMGELATLQRLQAFRRAHGRDAREET